MDSYNKRGFVSTLMAIFMQIVKETLEDHRC